MEKVKVPAIAPTHMQCTPFQVSRDLANQFLAQEVVISDPENHRAVWFGRVLTFSDAQLACWQMLWQNFFRGNLPMPQGRVLAAWHGESCQVSDIFKRHPAWRTIIVGDRKGHLWLHIPPEFLNGEAMAQRPSIRSGSGTAGVAIHG